MTKTFIRLLKIAAPFKWWMLLAAFFGFLTVGSSVGLMMTSAYIIAKAALHPSIAALQVGIVGVRFFGISRGLFRYLERIISHKVTFKLLAQLRVWFFTAIEPLAPARLQRYKSGDLLSRILSDINTLENFYIRVLAPALVAILVSILMWFLFGIFSWLFSVVLLFFMAAAGLGVPFLTRLMSRGVGKKLVVLESELSTLAVEGIQGMPELLLFGQADSHLFDFLQWNDELTGLQRKRAQINALHDALVNLLMNGAVFSIFLLAIPHVHAGVLDGVYLAVLALGTMAAFEAVMPLPQAANHLEENLAAAERLFEMTDMDHPISTPISEIHPESFDIMFRNVSFRYAADEPFVLENFSLEIPQGRTVAIVGPSGIGKTTIANVLMRFWQPQSGEIRIGGQSIQKYSQQQLTDIISYVPQNLYLFGGAIRENLLLAKPNATNNEIEDVCEKTHILKFINSLPDGFDTWIGEHGLRLSGGERQRLALARGLLKDVPVYIFDEPTANVDGETTLEIMKTIFNSFGEKTILIISHDPKAVDYFHEKLDRLIAL